MDGDGGKIGGEKKSWIQAESKYFGKSENVAPIIRRNRTTNAIRADPKT